MPRMTRNYTFEDKMIGGLRRLEEKLFGSQGEDAMLSPDDAFIARLDDAGKVIETFRRKDKHDLFVILQKFDDMDVPYLFYDPFDPMEYIYISWHRVSLKTAEKLLNVNITEKDLEPEDESKGEKLNEFPISHGVMF